MAKARLTGHAKLVGARAEVPVPRLNLHAERKGRVCAAGAAERPSSKEQSDSRSRPGGPTPKREAKRRQCNAELSHKSAPHSGHGDAAYLWNVCDLAHAH